MDDTAITAGLMTGDGGLLVEQHKTAAGPGRQQFHSGGEADDAAADYKEVIDHCIITAGGAAGGQRLLLVCRCSRLGVLVSLSPRLSTRVRGRHDGRARKSTSLNSRH